MTDQDGSRREIWRGHHATGANRADARLDIFGVSAQQLLTGVPQSQPRLPGEEENRRMAVRGLGEILRRVSRLNAEYADPERDPGHGPSRTRPGHPLRLGQRAEACPQSGGRRRPSTLRKKYRHPPGPISACRCVRRRRAPG
ncbi:hypothetical protein SGFS_002470 [Streptomyces graminofaciens]|uniref:Uncharacterized protein n=1 Tax=Streptomyces graminofaciens TaxID=68212 RepID=A0ABN5V7J5_9ACTN|nr:hypothetical protein [Streptomyces graminofaciens]BBC28956.1 hypothetical protein SGFS_002470 [Streptomyces graminofaciens]